MGWRTAGFNGATNVAFSANDLKCSQTFRRWHLDHAPGWEVPLGQNRTAGRRHLSWMRRPCGRVVMHLRWGSDRTGFESQFCHTHRWVTLGRFHHPSV